MFSRALLITHHHPLFLHSTLVLSFYIDVSLTRSIHLDDGLASNRQIAIVAIGYPIHQCIHASWCRSEFHYRTITFRLWHSKCHRKWRWFQSLKCVLTYDLGVTVNLPRWNKLEFMKALSDIPDSKIHGANMGPTWVLSAPDVPHVGPMNVAIRDVIPHSTSGLGILPPPRTSWWVNCTITTAQVISL